MPVALVPGVRALLPENASLTDPVADLRAACLTAVARLGSRVRVHASDAGGEKVAAVLLAAVGAESAGADAADAVTGVLVVGNGSAKRSEKAPGHLDDRAAGFDAALAADLGSADPALAAELWADTGALGVLAGRSIAEADVLYDDDPYGVQYWVAVWG
ncbi:hypothetical protein JK386_00430 [Nocardioides sp. zg-536]|uniref:Uncharacterized protein n=1 Tax=Nocardioides faecalis TaxID=2803858 RepID=A0A939BR88_9ACTN|nr:hypothetical protein [Nocardioides faecalis]QVI60720.1 hypothetical protein KG111_15510 [Nocardioides faecalis]